MALQGNLKQQAVFRSAFMTMDATLMQENNSLLYFRNFQGPRDSSGNAYFALQAPIGDELGLRLNKYTSSGTLIGTGYLYDTLFNSPYVAVPFFSSVIILGNNVLPRTLLNISSTSSSMNVLNDTDNGISYIFTDNTSTASGTEFYYYKMRNSGASQNNDTIGSFSFYGRNTLNTDVLAASITVSQDSVAGPGSVSGKVSFKTTTTGGSNTEKVLIDNNNTYIKGDTSSVSGNPFGGSGDNGQLIINSNTSPVTRLGLGVDTVNDIGVIQAVNSVTNAGKGLSLNPTVGNVGIGTANPLTKCQISFTSTLATDWFFSNGQQNPANGFSFWPSMLGKGMYMDLATNNIIVNTPFGNAFGAAISNDSDGGMDFFTSFIPSVAGVPQVRTFADLFRMRLDQNGNLGIGLKNPAARLDISGSENIRTIDNTAFANNLSFYKSRANLQTNSGDELGWIGFHGKDTTNTDRRAGRIIGRQDGVAVNGYTRGKISLVTTDTAGTERSILEVNSSKQVVLPDTTAAATGPNLNFNKSRNNFTTSNLDTLGQVVFNGVDTGNVLRNAAYIQGTQDGVAGASFVPGKISFFTTDSGGNSAERLSVESSGVRVTSIVKQIDAPPPTTADWIPYYNTIIFPSNTYTYTLSVASPAPDGTTLTFKNALGAGSILINATNPASVTIPAGSTAKFVYVSNTSVPFIGAAIGWYQIQ
jgi:hypothetical protein